MTDAPPDRLSTNPASPHHDAAALERGVGIRFKGVEKTNVEEYCVSEGWIRVAAGKAKDPARAHAWGRLRPSPNIDHRRTSPRGLSALEHYWKGSVMAKGTVKWFNAEKGFGFIQPDDGSKDVFVHISILGPSGVHHLAEGQAVNMRVVDTPKGREALSISLA